MIGELWLLLAAALIVLANRRHLRRAWGLRLRGRTLCWHLRPTVDGGFRARGMALRLYGVSGMPDWCGTLGLGLPARQSEPVRFRVLSVDRDGTLVVLARRNGVNIAVERLQYGLVATLGTGSRRYRQMQAAAQAGRMGLWRQIEIWHRPRERGPRIAAPVFPWWQG